MVTRGYLDVGSADGLYQSRETQGAFGFGAGRWTQVSEEVSVHLGSGARKFPPALFWTS